MDIVAGIYLFIQGIWDIKKKEIPLWISIGFGTGSFFYSICLKREWTCLCLALIPGLFCLFLGKCTRQAIGYGDGILLCALGMFYDIEAMVGICMIAFGLAGFLALVMLGIFQKSGKSELPFVPFLFMGWLFWHGIQMMGEMV